MTDRTENRGYDCPSGHPHLHADPVTACGYTEPRKGTDGRRLKGAQFLKIEESATDRVARKIRALEREESYRRKVRAQASVLARRAYGQPRRPVTFLLHADTLPAYWR